MVCMDDPIKPVEVLVKLDLGKAGSTEQGANGVALIKSDFNEDGTGWFKVSRSLGRDDPVGREPIWATIEGKGRIERADFRRKGLKDLGRDIGRVGDDEIEALASVESGEPVALQHLQTLADAVPFGVLARGGESFGSKINGEGRCVGAVGENGNRDAAGSGAQIKQAPAGWQACNCKIDQQFGFGTWLERSGIEPERQAVKLAFADDAGNRFAGHAPFG